MSDAQSEDSLPKPKAKSEDFQCCLLCGKLTKSKDIDRFNKVHACLNDDRLCVRKKPIQCRLCSRLFCRPFHAENLYACRYCMMDYDKNRAEFHEAEAEKEEPPPPPSLPPNASAKRAPSMHPLLNSSLWVRPAAATETSTETAAETETARPPSQMFPGHTAKVEPHQAQDDERDPFFIGDSGEAQTVTKMEDVSRNTAETIGDYDQVDNLVPAQMVRLCTRDVQPNRGSTTPSFTFR